MKLNKPATIFSSDRRAFPNGNCISTMADTFVKKDLAICGPNQIQLDMEGVGVTESPAGIKSGANIPSKRFIKNINFNYFSGPEPNRQFPIVSKQDKIKEYIWFREEAKSISLKALQDRVYVNEKRHTSFQTTAQDSFTPNKLQISQKITPQKPNITSNIPNGDPSKVKTTKSVAKASFKKPSLDSYVNVRETSNRIIDYCNPYQNNVLPKFKFNLSTELEGYSTTNTRTFPQHQIDTRNIGKRINIARGKSYIALGEQVNVNAILERDAPKTVFQEDFLEKDLQSKVKSDVSLRLKALCDGSKTAFDWNAHNINAPSSGDETRFMSSHERDYHQFDPSVIDKKEAEIEQTVANGRDINYRSNAPQGDAKIFNFDSFSTINKASFKKFEKIEFPTFPKLGEKVTLSFVQFGETELPQDKRLQPPIPLVSTSRDSFVNHGVNDPKARHTYTSITKKTFLGGDNRDSEYQNVGEPFHYHMLSTKADHFSDPKNKSSTPLHMHAVKIHAPPTVPRNFMFPITRGNISPLNISHTHSNFKLRGGILDVAGPIEQRGRDCGKSSIVMGDLNIRDGLSVGM